MIALSRKLGGVALLLALWLSFVPVAQAGAIEIASGRTVSTPAALTQLLVSEKVVLAQNTAAIRDNPDRRDADSGNAPVPVPLGYSSPILTPSQLHGLPAPTGPPRSSPPHHFQARAPPVA